MEGRSSSLPACICLEVMAYVGTILRTEEDLSEISVTLTINFAKAVTTESMIFHISILGGVSIYRKKISARFKGGMNR